jgi:hypothetical protein
MEKRFKSLSLFEFQNRFRSDDDCMEHLSLLIGPMALSVKGARTKSIVKVHWGKQDNVQSVVVRPHLRAVHFFTRLNFLY